MPNLASAKKRLRQDVKKALRNQIAKTRIKTEIKKALTGEESKGAFGAIDRAAAKGIIHKNTAARKKSRLAKRLAASSTTTA
jgi:small subunit ribosomal protein S20